MLGNRIGGVMVSIIGSSAVDRGLNQRLYAIGICCFSDKHAALRRKSRLVGSNCFFSELAH